jgi:hypothetical protein
VTAFVPSGIPRSVASDVNGFGVALSLQFIREQIEK